MKHTSSLSIEASQQPRHFLILLLDLIQRRLNQRQAFRPVRFVHGARLVLHRAEVLDLLAGVLDLGEAQGGGGPFEEMAETGELGEVTAGAIVWSVGGLTKV